MKEVLEFEVRARALATLLPIITELSDSATKAKYLSEVFFLLREFQLSK